MQSCLNNFFRNSVDFLYDDIHHPLLDFFLDIIVEEKVKLRIGNLDNFKIII